MPSKYHSACLVHLFCLSTQTEDMYSDFSSCAVLVAFSATKFIFVEVNYLSPSTLEICVISGTTVSFLIWEMVIAFCRELNDDVRE